MKTDIVIPVRNNLELTKDIVAQLQNQPGWRYCLIFDNGSTDGTNDWLRDLTYQDDRFYPYWEPDLTIYQMWNKGFQYAVGDKADYVAILNNDIRLCPNVIQKMGFVMDQHPEIGLIYPDYGRPTWKGVDYDTNKQETRYTQGTYRHGGMSGFCFMIRTSIVAWSPLIDETYKLWYGDDDLAFTVAKAGHKQARLMGWPLDHIGQATANQHPEVFQSIPADKTYFEKKWGAGK